MGIHMGWHQEKIRKSRHFETTLIGPSGQADLKVTKTVIKGMVNMGGQMPHGKLTVRAYTRKMEPSFLKPMRRAGLIGEWDTKSAAKEYREF